MIADIRLRHHGLCPRCYNVLFYEDSHTDRTTLGSRNLLSLFVECCGVEVYANTYPVWEHALHVGSVTVGLNPWFPRIRHVENTPYGRNH